MQSYIIKQRKISYGKKIIYALILPSVLFLVIFSIGLTMSLDIVTNLLVSLLSFILLFIRRLYEYKFYILRLIVHNNNVYIEYYKWNKILTIKIKSYDLRVIKGLGYIGKVCNFKIGRKKILSQYEVIYWKRKDIDELCSVFKNLNLIYYS